MNTIYQNCKVYGPYASSIDGRLRVIIKFSNKKKKTVSYPKYLIELHLDRYLDKDETVDHIDNNFLNNDLSNLRILSRSEHAKQDVYRNKDIKITCQQCGILFTIPGNKINYRNRRQSSGFCSKKCSGLYGKSVQTTGITKGKVELEKVKYQEKSLVVGNSTNEEQNIGEALTRNGDGNTEA